MNQSTGNICLDGIVFGLQHNGGISNYWARLLDSNCYLQTEKWRTVLPKSVKYLDYKIAWQLSNSTKEKLPSTVSRYLPCALEPTDTVFHTSYYRLPSRKVKRYVVTAYDFMYERYRVGPALWVHSFQKNTSIERADVVACISAFTRDEVLEFCPKVDPLRLKVIPLGVDTGVFYPDRQIADSELADTALFVGQRGGYKRFELAVESVRALAQLRFGIVGPRLTAEETTFLNAKLGSRWRYIGSVSVTRLRELYSSAYALIFPSDCEGFGLPVLEAMACGCPVVAANRASLPEVGGAAALYADRQHHEDYAQALQKLDLGILRAEVIDAGKSRVLSFSWRETTSATRALYTE